MVHLIVWTPLQTDAVQHLSNTLLILSSPPVLCKCVLYTYSASHYFNVKLKKVSRCTNFSIWLLLGEECTKEFLDIPWTHALTLWILVKIFVVIFSLPHIVCVMHLVICSPVGAFKKCAGSTSINTFSCGDIFYSPAALSTSPATDIITSRSLWTSPPLFSKIVFRALHLTLAENHRRWLKFNFLMALHQVQTIFKPTKLFACTMWAPILQSDILLYIFDCFLTLQHLQSLTWCWELPTRHCVVWTLYPCNKAQTESYSKDPAPRTSSGSQTDESTAGTQCANCCLTLHLDRYNH